MAHKYIAATIVAGLVIALSTISLGAIAKERETNYRSVSSSKEVAIIQEHFQLDLIALGFGGKIQSCKNVIAIPRTEDSIGAICSLEVSGKIKYVLICEDNMLGSTALVSSFVWSDEWVAAFTRQNCVKG